MSNKTQLSNNNTKLASLIQELQGKAAGGGESGVTNVDTCSFHAIKDGLPYSYNGDLECCWTEFYEGVFEYCQDSGGANLGVSGMPVCNTVLGVWWSNYSGYTSSVEVNGAEIIHQTASSATILMPAEAGSSVQVMVIYSR